jgi:hypothetical protein
VSFIPVRSTKQNESSVLFADDMDLDVPDPSEAVDSNNLDDDFAFTQPRLAYFFTALPTVGPGYSYMVLLQGESQPQHRT